MSRENETNNEVWKWITSVIEFLVASIVISQRPVRCFERPDERRKYRSANFSHRNLTPPPQINAAGN